MVSMMPTIGIETSLTRVECRWPASEMSYITRLWLSSGRYATGKHALLIRSKLSFLRTPYGCFVTRNVHKTTCGHDRDCQCCRCDEH
jgi:hypothetical protein